MFQAAYLRDGRLLSWLQGLQARRFMMEKIAETFEWGRLYQEQEVNALLKAIYPEPATLRRELIDQKLLLRAHGRYWLMKPPADQQVKQANARTLAGSVPAPMHGPADDTLSIRYFLHQ